MTAGTVNYEDIDFNHKLDIQHLLWSINFNQKAHKMCAIRTGGYTAGVYVHRKSEKSNH